MVITNKFEIVAIPKFSFFLPKKGLSWTASFEHISTQFAPTFKKNTVRIFLLDKLSLKISKYT